jgi:copper homeostasis protein
MKEDVICCKELGCEGIVIGMLKKDGSIDTDRCSELIALAGSMQITFHRAFDRCSDLKKGLEDIIQLGCHRVLTSGGKEYAVEGIELLKSLVIQAGSRIIIMPGSGINPLNLLEIAEVTSAHEFHTTAKKLMEYDIDPINDEPYRALETSAETVFELKEILSLI